MLDLSLSKHGGREEMSEDGFIVYRKWLPEDAKRYFDRIGCKAMWFKICPSDKSPAERLMEVMQEKVVKK